MRRLLRFLYTRSRRTKIALTLLAIFFGLLAFIYGWLFADLPSIDQLQAGLALPSTRIYDRNGQLLYEILPPEGGRNTAIPLEEIPELDLYPGPLTLNQIEQIRQALS